MRLFLKTIAVLLIVTIGVELVTWKDAPREARANPAVLAAPAVAIGALEAALFAVAVAATIGLITMAQEKEYHDKIEYCIESIKNGTKKAMRASLVAAEKLLDEINHLIHRGVATPTCPMAAEQVMTHTAVQTAERSTACSSPKDCCKPLFDRFEKVFRSDNKIKGGQAYRVKYRNAAGQKVECCLEWDQLHSGWEVFFNGVHGGEHSCTDDGDLCDYTKSTGKHALPDAMAGRSNHRPRFCPDLKSAH